MKNFYLPGFFRIVILVAVSSLTHCNKVNDIIRNLPDCEVQQYNFSPVEGISPFLYKKIYDQSGKFVEQIDFTFFSLSVTELRRYLVRYHQKKLLLINKDNPADTAMVVRFNAWARPETISTSWTFFTINTRFTYRNNRLDSIIFSQFPPIICADVKMCHFDQICDYDNKGNVLAIKRYLPEYGEYEGSFYEYDYSRIIKQQVYHDGPEGPLEFPFVILQYLDLFPELNPRNVRVRTRVGLESNPYLWNEYLFNHRVDGNGKLLGYDIGYVMGQTDYPISLDWKCNKDHAYQ